MANYVLIYSGGQMADSPAEQAAGLKEWQDWFGKLGSATIDGGNPFTGQARTVASDGKTSDGPGVETASGYSILKADSLAEAVAMAKGCPVLKVGGKLTVYETFNAMG